MKSTGDSRTLSQLRADVAAALLTGTADITDCSAPTTTGSQADQTPGETEQDQTEQDQAAKEQAEQGETGQCDAEGSAPHGQGETERTDTQSEQVPDEQAQGEPQKASGVQGHCAVHRFPDHDRHSADCDCGDCAPAGTGNTTPHYAPATALPRTTPPPSATQLRRTQPPDFQLQGRSRSRTDGPMR
ncbi:hypothetical protein [Actinopolymorpha rutila]|uniref:Cobalamin biosynthesis protein CobT n=1 Tax=Actinopolymorpha rutila TaxID=446787 RepID=A0A852ZV72_9ACTN|nr:hypothetical protein [Actinopolymorpha rutila]NYH93219.1 cobalamin biosynthesis protein CobT [Actinopolymorpha rutila]